MDFFPPFLKWLPEIVVAIPFTLLSRLDRRMSAISEQPRRPRGLAASNLKNSLTASQIDARPRESSRSGK